MAFKCDALYMLILICINVTFCFVIFYAMYYLFFDHSIVRFIIILTIFVTWMNIFLLAYDFLTAYIAWEFIGLFSFFLISYFWFRYYALKCGFKAFVIGKFGDLSLFIAFILLYKHTGFLMISFFYLNTMLDYYFITYLILTVTLCASTKSTQFGLHIWLPDAMEGPIPVSALIHAATLVVCGILMVSFILPCMEFWLSNIYFIVFWALCLLVLNAITTLNNFDVKFFCRLLFIDLFIFYFILFYFYFIFGFLFCFWLRFEFLWRLFFIYFWFLFYLFFVQSFFFLFYLVFWKSFFRTVFCFILRDFLFWGEAGFWAYLFIYAIFVLLVCHFIYFIFIFILIILSFVF